MLSICPVYADNNLQMFFHFLETMVKFDFQALNSWKSKEDSLPYVSSFYPRMSASSRLLALCDLLKEGFLLNSSLLHLKGIHICQQEG
jgi:hypothetical protein